MHEESGCPQEDLATLSQLHAVIVPPSSSLQTDAFGSLRGTHVHWEKGNVKTFWGLSDMGSEMTLSLRTFFRKLLEQWVTMLSHREGP